VAPMDLGLSDDRASRSSLAETIERTRSDIVRLWLERVDQEVQRSGKALSVSELRDGLEDYLARIAEELRSDRAIAPGGAAAWRDIAREHAVTRVRQGFDIDQLVREFIILRQVIAEVLHEEGVAVEGQLVYLADLIEGAIAQAVKSYVDSRDFESRRLQAEQIGFLTHELRNPLTIAMISASRLQNKAQLKGPAQRSAELLARSLERLKSLIDGVLTAEKLEAGEVEARTTQVALGEIMEEALRAARMQALDRGLALDASFDSEVTLQIDPKLTISALQNVVDNAVKFTDEGRVEVVAEAEGDKVVVHVYDNCEGISEEELTTIFEPFRRGHTRRPGTGLGLAIARRSIEAQGGKIGADARSARGCHFWLTLPRAKQ
jgi:signal transduction histidine kinase